ncbi:unnamed protein product, partial [Choristocarpus tenellus]
TLIFPSSFEDGLAFATSRGVFQDFSLDENSVRHYGVVVDEDTGDVYIGTSVAIKKLSQQLDKSWTKSTIVGGWVEYQVVGYNLGVGMDDVVHLSVLGVECATILYESSNSLRCISGDSNLGHSDSGEGITAADFIVQTRNGGWSEGGYPRDFEETEIADHSLKPIVTFVQASFRDLSPHALVLDKQEGFLYYSNIASQSVERVALNGSAMEVFMPDVGLVYGMALDTDNRYIYYTENQEGIIGRFELVRGKGSPLIESLVTDLVDPMGIALDLDGDGLFFTLYRGVIGWAKRNISYTELNSLNTTKNFSVIRQMDTAVRLDGIAVARSDAINDPTELRLYWTESGPWHVIQRSTVNGLGVETLVRSGINGGDILWPRGLILDPSGSGIYFTEFLGTVRWLSTLGDGEDPPVTLLRADTYAAAVAVKSKIGKAKRQGIDGSFFMEGLH